MTSVDDAGVDLLKLRVLQRNWRNAFCAKRTPWLVKKYLDAGLHSSSLASMSFEDLHALVSNKKTIKIAKACLQRIHMVSVFLHGSPAPNPADSTVNTRVFLGMYLIIHFRANVFERPQGELESTVFDAAIKLLAHFEIILTAISEKGGMNLVSPAVYEGFPAALVGYLESFKAWKVPDQTKLSLRIKHALRALYHARGAMDEHSNDPLRLEFTRQIARLWSKLYLLARQDVDPFKEELAGSGLVFPPGDPALRESGIPVMPREVAVASSELLSCSKLSMEQVAHNLLLDPSWRHSLDSEVSAGAQNNAVALARTSLIGAFWDSLVDDLRLSVPTRVLWVVKDICEGLEVLEQGCTSSLNLAAAVCQLEERGVSAQTCISFLSALFDILCKFADEPTRVRFVPEWATCLQTLNTSDDFPVAFVKAIQTLRDYFDTVRVAVANERLAQIAPVIQEHGVAYERAKFNERLANEGTTALTRTEAVFRMAMVDLVPYEDGEEMFKSIHARVMAMVVTRGLILENHVIPETLCYDMHTIVDAQAEMGKLVFSSAAITMIRYLLPQHPAIVAECSKIIADTPYAASASLSKALSSLDPPLSARCMRVLTKADDKDDVVRIIAVRRLTDALAHYIAHGTHMEGLGSTGGIMRVVKDEGMEPAFTAVCTKIHHVAKFNRMVYVPWYKDLVGRILSERA